MTHEGGGRATDMRAHAVYIILNGVNARERNLSGDECSVHYHSLQDNPHQARGGVRECPQQARGTVNQHVATIHVEPIYPLRSDFFMSATASIKAAGSSGI